MSTFAQRIRPRVTGTVPLATWIASIASFATLAGCGTPPADLDLRLDRPSAAGTYRVALVPPETMPAINRRSSRPRSEKRRS